MQPSNPIVVRVVEEPVETTGISDILIGALGLTGVMLLAALVFGLRLGGILIAIKRIRARYDLDAPPETNPMRVTPS